MFVRVWVQVCQVKASFHELFRAVRNCTSGSAAARSSTTTHLRAVGTRQQVALASKLPHARPNWTIDLTTHLKRVIIYYTTLT